MTPQEKNDRSLFKNIGDETTLEEYLPQLVAIEKAASEKWLAAAAALRQAQEDCEKARAEWAAANTETTQLKWILDRNKFAEHKKKWSKA